MDKITKLSEITDESLKQVKASVIHEFVASELEKACLEHDKIAKTAKSAAEVAEAARLEIEAKQKELLATVETLKEKLATFEKEKQEKEVTDIFNARMASLDEKFNLTPEDRKEIVTDVKGLSEDAFAAYERKLNVFLANKLKNTKASQSTASADNVIDDALKNADKTSQIPNTSTPEPVSLKEKYSSAFAVNEFVLVEKNNKIKEI